MWHNGCTPDEEGKWIMQRNQRQLGTLIVIVLAIVFALVNRQSATTDVVPDSAVRQAPASSVAPRSRQAPAATTAATPRRQPSRAASTSTSASDTTTSIAFDDLPREAQDTIQLIEQGGPFPYDQDDSVFRNREGILPRQPNGYYREYTVETPGSDDRGARRVVAGRNGELYYTDDHYESFSRIR